MITIPIRQITFRKFAKVLHISLIIAIVSTFVVGS